MVELLHAAPEEKVEEQPQNPQQQTHMEINWEKVVKDLILKDPQRIRSMVADLDPDSRAMIFQIIEAKYPGYSGLAKMIIGNGNGNGKNQEQEDEDDGDRGFETEDLPDERPPSQGIIQQAINDTVTMYESGMAPKDISEQIYSLYDLDWNVQTIYRVVQRHQAFKQAPAPVKKEEPKIIIPKEPHRGVIRRIAHWLW